MFAPVLQVGASIIWHYLVNEDYSWMSHALAKEHCSSLALVDCTSLESSRHFVGWTRKADTLTG